MHLLMPHQTVFKSNILHYTVGLNKDTDAFMYVYKFCMCMCWLLTMSFLRNEG